MCVRVHYRRMLPSAIGMRPSGSILRAVRQTCAAERVGELVLLLLLPIERVCEHHRRQNAGEPDPLHAEIVALPPPPGCRALVGLPRPDARRASTLERRSMLGAWRSANSPPAAPRARWRSHSCGSAISAVELSAFAGAPTTCQARTAAEQPPLFLQASRHLAIHPPRRRLAGWPPAPPGRLRRPAHRARAVSRRPAGPPTPLPQIDMSGRSWLIVLGVVDQPPDVGPEGGEAEPARGRVGEPDLGGQPDDLER